MNSQDFRAMVSLLDDNDAEVVVHIEEQIRGLGQTAIPMLEKERGDHKLSPAIQTKIGDILQNLHYEKLYFDFQEWVANGASDLLRGLWLVARFGEPDLKVETLRDGINKIYLDVWPKTSQDMHPVDILAVINDTLFNVYGFEPNIKNFHSPRNCFFNKVLEKKTGNPVALSCIYILLAQKLDLPIYGVSLPNLFVVLYDYPGNRFYINPFNKGQIFYEKDIDDYVKHMNLETHPRYYNACSHREIILRKLTNLLYAYQKIGDPAKESQVYQIMKVLK